jgi:hypothetical protein
VFSWSGILIKHRDKFLTSAAFIFRYEQRGSTVGKYWWRISMVVTCMSMVTKFRCSIIVAWTGADPEGCVAQVKKKKGQIDFFILSNFKFLARAVLCILLAFSLRVSSFESTKCLGLRIYQSPLYFDWLITSPSVAYRGFPQRGSDNGDWTKVDMKKISRSVCNQNLSPIYNVIRSSLTL